jgi:5-methylcytosine-specific restriction endonuclease McrA
MKYELEPDNRSCPDDVLLDDLRSVARRLGQASLTQEAYDQHGRFSPTTIKNRFDSWNHALALSGLAVQKRMNIPREESVADLQHVAELIGMRTVSTSDYRTHGKFGRKTFTDEFGSWAKALTAAGLQPTGWKPKATDDELLSNMASVWESVGRQPKQKDFRPPVSRFSCATYVNHYKSWRKALEAFVTAANKEEPAIAKCESKEQEIAPTVPQEHKHRTPRQPGWRLTFLVHRRDNFKCRICGRSPATHPGVVLRVDHIIPWDSGGETVIENLQALCEPCNGGKSNLPMQEN